MNEYATPAERIAVQDDRSWRHDGDRPYWNLRFGGLRGQQGAMIPSIFIYDKARAERIAEYLRQALAEDFQIEQQENEKRMERFHVEDKVRAKASAKADKAKRKQQIIRLKDRMHLGTELQERAVCPHCEHRAEPEEFEHRIYECSACGTKATDEEEWRCCDQCGKFRAKLADHCCPECSEAIDEELGLVHGHVLDGEFLTEAECAELLKEG